MNPQDGYYAAMKRHASSGGGSQQGQAQIGQGQQVQGGATSSYGNPPSNDRRNSQQQSFGLQQTNPSTSSFVSGTSPTSFNFSNDEYPSLPQNARQSSFSQPSFGPSSIGNGPVQSRQQQQNDAAMMQQSDYARLAHGYAQSLVSNLAAGHPPDSAGLSLSGLGGYAMDGSGMGYIGLGDGSDMNLGGLGGMGGGGGGVAGGSNDSATMSLSMALALGMLDQHAVQGRAMNEPVSGILRPQPQPIQQQQQAPQLRQDDSQMNGTHQPLSNGIGMQAFGQGQVQNHQNGISTNGGRSNRPSMSIDLTSVRLPNAHATTAASTSVAAQAMQQQQKSPSSARRESEKTHQRFRSTDENAGDAVFGGGQAQQTVDASARPTIATSHDKSPPRRHSTSTAPSASAPFMPSAASAESTSANQSHANSEFTKRKGWSQTLMNEIQDFFHVLAPAPPSQLDLELPPGSDVTGVDGNRPNAVTSGVGPVFLWVSPSSFDLTGHEVDELIGKPILSFVHEDDRDVVRREIARSYERDRRKAFGTITNQSATSTASLNKGKGKRKADDYDTDMTDATSNSNDQRDFVSPERDRFLIYYRFRKRDGKYLVLECRGHHIFDRPSTAGVTASTMPPQPVCKAFVGVSRPYPSKNTALMDAVLSLRMENEKLLMELEDLYEDIEPGGGGRVNGLAMTLRTVISDRRASGNESPPRFASAAPSPGGSTASGSDGRHSPPPHVPSSFGRTLGGMGGAYSFNNGSINTGGRVDASAGVISAAGLIPSTSNTYGALGIGISPSNFQAGGGAEGRSANKKDNSTKDAATKKEEANAAKTARKKQRAEEGEFVCHDCGTVDSPEWRKGPQGPKSLCNACGLRWAKRTKQIKNQQKAAAAGGAAPPPTSAAS